MTVKIALVSTQDWWSERFYSSLVHDRVSISSVADHDTLSEYDIVIVDFADPTCNIAEIRGMNPEAIILAIVSDDFRLMRKAFGSGASDCFTTSLLNDDDLLRAEFNLVIQQAQRKLKECGKKS